jgi:hypothetical protein
MFISAKYSVFNILRPEFTTMFDQTPLSSYGTLCFRFPTECVVSISLQECTPAHQNKRAICVGLQFRHPSSNYLTPFFPNKVLRSTKDTILSFHMYLITISYIGYHSMFLYVIVVILCSSIIPLTNVIKRKYIYAKKQGQMQKYHLSYHSINH